MGEWLGPRRGREVEPCEDAHNGDHCQHWYGDKQRPCCTCGDDSPDGCGPPCEPGLSVEEMP